MSTKPLVYVRLEIVEMLKSPELVEQLHDFATSLTDIPSGKNHLPQSRDAPSYNLSI
ncbi:MAG: hypothetical protein AAF702_06145 [Chloroflexota bacterium]